MLIETLHKCGDNFGASVRGLGNVVDVRKETRFETVVEEIRRKSSVTDGSGVDGHFDGVDDVVPANATLLGNAE